MKEEHVTYEQAIKLKELGFDWKCLYHYSNRGTIFSNSKGNSDGWGVYVEELECSYNETNRGFIDAPTLSEAAAWLREVKELHVLPHLENVNKPDYVCTITLMRKERIRITDNGRYFPSYESALSAGIDKALELLTDKLNDK